LTGISVEARGAGDVDDVTGFVVAEAKVWGGGADELEGSGAVEGYDGVPLLVGGLSC
jgi:hypothetical protein